MHHGLTDRPESEDQPPVLERWERIYGLVIFELIVCILLFYFFERMFS